MAKPTTSETLHIIKKNHPSLPGHFPDRPVVPGVVIIDKVLSQIEAYYPQWKITGIKKIKYRQLLLPDQSFIIHFAKIKNDSLRFKCQLNNNTILVEGHFKLQAKI